MTLILPVTLSAAAAAAIINIWLMMRVGQVRLRDKVSIGDGGNDALLRRMRAHSNFTESAPFVLILLGVIELSGKGTWWLVFVAGIYLLARVAHSFGMDNGDSNPGRLIGTIVTMLTLLGLAIVAVLITSGVV